MDGLADILTALGNDIRIGIVKLLVARRHSGVCDAGCSVSEISSHFRIANSTLTHHLTVLRNAGLIRSRREGRNIFYEAEIENLKSVVTAISELIESDVD